MDISKIGQPLAGINTTMHNIYIEPRMNRILKDRVNLSRPKRFDHNSKQITSGFFFIFSIQPSIPVFSLTSTFVRRNHMKVNLKPSNPVILPFTASSRSESSQSGDEIEVSKQISEISQKYEHNLTIESGASTESSPLKRQLSEELFSRKDKCQKLLFTGYL